MLSLTSGPRSTEDTNQLQFHGKKAAGDGVVVVVVVVDLLLEGSNPKIDDNQVPGICIYIYMFKYLRKTIHILMFSAAMADFRAKPVRRHSQSPRPGEFVGAFGRPSWGTVLGG